MEEKESNEMEMAEKENEKKEEKEKSQIISEDKINKYFKVAEEALKEIKITNAKGVCINLDQLGKEFLEVAQNYYNDAKHYHEKGDTITAFAALNYAHGWLDSGVKLGLFKVKSSKLFAFVD